MVDLFIDNMIIYIYIYIYIYYIYIYIYIRKLTTGIQILDKSMPSLSGPLWPGGVPSDRVLSLCQLELNCVLMLN